MSRDFLKKKTIDQRSVTNYFGILINILISTLKWKYLAKSLYNLDGNYDVKNKNNKADHNVIIIIILLKATKEFSVLKVTIGKDLQLLLCNLSKHTLFLV